MTETSPYNIVVVAAADPELANALFTEVSIIQGVAGTYLASAEDDWSKLPSGVLSWAFVDAALITKKIEVYLQKFQHLVLFNCLANEKRVRGFIESKEMEESQLFVRKENYLLTEFKFRQVYSKLVAPAKHQIDPKHLVRCSSIPAGTHHLIYNGPLVRADALERFLSSLRSGITEEYSSLTRNFVASKSFLTIPPSQQLLSIAPSELGEAEAKLSFFATDKDSRQKGCFLIGKKGTGKSTLAYYVGRTLNHKQKVCCVGIDYTLETEFSTQGRLIPMLESFLDNWKGLRFSEEQDHRYNIVSRVRDVLAEIIDHDTFDILGGISLNAQVMLETDTDRGFLIHLFCYYEKHGSSPENCFITHMELASLINEAEHWYDSLKRTPKKLFVFYLYFLLNKHAFDSIAAYTHRAILRYLLSTEEHSEKALTIFRNCMDKMTAEGPKGENSQALNQRRALLLAKDFSLSELRSMVTSILEKLVDNRPLLILIDNIDQRTNTYTEAITIFGALKVFDEHIAPYFTDARAIIAMRDSTIHSQEWSRISLDLTKGSKHVFVLPPDLKTVLQKRCAEWQSGGYDIGAAGYREAMQVVNWVDDFANTQRRDEGRPQQSLFEIIENRHPFNVREQLRTFTQCCENVVLHRAMAKPQTSSDVSRPSWAEKSFEFFLRVFLHRDLRYFSEEYCELANVFDNGFSQSPFSACIRSWVLWSVDDDVDVENARLIQIFVEAGVPQKEVESALNALVKYKLFIPLPDDTKSLLSIWGKYFRKYIAYDLPYVSTVWWTTNMLRDFTLGAAREVLPSELRSYAGIFCHWIECEEELARSQLAKGHSLSLPEIYRTLSGNLSWSLRNIERVIL